MINNRKGNVAIVNLISVAITIIIIVAVGFVYYTFLSPEELQLDLVVYEKLDSEDYEIDTEFEKGLDKSIEVKYTDDDLDMHRDLKDYYQGREDPFAQSEDRNTIINLDGQKTDEEKIKNSKSELIIEEEIDIKNEEKNTGNSSIIQF